MTERPVGEERHSLVQPSDCPSGAQRAAGGEGPLAAPETFAVLEVPSSLEPYAEAALTRLRYAHPGCHLVLQDNKILVKSCPGGEIASLERDLAHQLYREKILAESWPLRAAIYRQILSQ